MPSPRLLSRLRRRRPSAPMLVALAALVVAMTGTAAAAGYVITSSSQIKNDTIRASDLTPAARAWFTEAGPQGPKGEQGPKGDQGPAGQDAVLPTSTLYATVALSGTTPSVDRGQGVVSVARLTPGVERVTFDRDVSGCSWLATAGSAGSRSAGPYLATTELQGESDATARSQVIVRTFDDGGAATLADSDFHVAAFCPNGR